MDTCLTYHKARFEPLRPEPHVTFCYRSTKVVQTGKRVPRSGKRLHTKRAWVPAKCRVCNVRKFGAAIALCVGASDFDRREGTEQGGRKQSQTGDATARDRLTDGKPVAR